MVLALVEAQVEAVLRGALRLRLTRSTYEVLLVAAAAARPAVAAGFVEVAPARPWPAVAVEGPLAAGEWPPLACLWVVVLGRVNSSRLRQ